MQVFDTIEKGPASRLVGVTESMFEEDGVYKLPFTVTPEHLNFHDSLQAGIQYFLCIEALSQYMVIKGNPGVGMEGSIHHYRAAHAGDRLFAVIRERKVGKTVGTYVVELVKDDGTLIADTMFSIMFGRR